MCPFRGPRDIWKLQRVDGRVLDGDSLGKIFLRPHGGSSHHGPSYGQAVQRTQKALCGLQEEEPAKVPHCDGPC